MNPSYSVVWLLRQFPERPRPFTGLPPGHAGVLFIVALPGILLVALSILLLLVSILALLLLTAPAYWALREPGRKAPAPERAGSDGHGVRRGPVRPAASVWRRRWSNRRNDRGVCGRRNVAAERRTA